MAIKRWIGGAPATKRVMLLTLANTWASADTARVSVGIQDLLVVTDSATKSVIATQIAAAINAASPTEDLVSAEARNVGGQEIAEFREFTAEASGDTVILTANTEGVDFNVTAGETTAGDGTLTASVTTAGSGPNHVGNLDNYEGGALPVDGDTLICDVGQVDMLYELDYFRTNNIELHLIITGDYRGQIGLPAYNTQGGYDEYRTRGLQLHGDSADHDITFRESTGGFLSTAGNVYLDATSQSMRTLDILAARGSTSGGPTIHITGGSFTTINALRGAVAIEPDDFNVTAGQGVIVTGAINIGVTEGQAAETVVYFGSLMRLCESGTLNIRNGLVVSYANTKVSTDVITTTIYGGTLRLSSSGDQDTFIVYGGAVLMHDSGGGTTTAVTLHGGTLDMSGGTAAQTITTLTVAPQASVNGGGGRLTAGATWI